MKPQHPLLKFIPLVLLILLVLVIIVLWATGHRLRREHAPKREYTIPTVQVIEPYREYLVIAESITASPKTTSSGKPQTFSYGDRIYLDNDLQYYDKSGKPTGLSIKSFDYVLLSVVEPLYKKVAPIEVKTYKEIPSRVKQALFNQTLENCGLAVNYKSYFPWLYGEKTGSVTVVSYPTDWTTCNPNLSLSRFKNVAERSVAYNDLDSDGSGDTDVVLLLEQNNDGYYGGQECSGSVFLYTLDANNLYVTKQVQTGGSCGVVAVKKGEVFQIKTITYKDNKKTESTEPFVFPTNGFIATGSNNSKYFIIYSSETNNQIKVINDYKEVYLDQQYGEGEEG